MRKLASIILAVLVGLSVGGALAANLTIGQKGRMFSSESVSIKKGATLTFLNDDSVPHNIISTSKGNEFDLGSQPPGASTDVTFKEAGNVQVIVLVPSALPAMKLPSGSCAP